jgi:hypothetical protein
MSGGKGYKPPPPPDPYKVAAAQTQTNVQTALAQQALNQYEEINPYGRTYYEPTGQVRNFGAGGESTGGSGGSGFDFNGDGRISMGERFRGGMQSMWGGGNGAGSNFSIPVMRRVTEFSPEQQRIFDAEMDTTGDLYDLANAYTARVAKGLENPFSYEGMPGAPMADEKARQQAIDAVYGQMRSRLDPQFDQDRGALEQKLANQGISIGSDAWNAEMDRFGRTRNDAYNSALNQAIAAGGAEQSRLFGLQQAARERAIQEAAYLRDRPINEITALTSGRGVTLPQFAPTPQVGLASPDLMGAVYNSYNHQVQNANLAAQQSAGGLGALTGGLGKLFGAIIASDRRLKDNIHPTGVSVHGIPVKTWNWKGTGAPDMGFVAQDVKKKMPGAVVKGPGGYQHVNYGKIFGLGG